MHGEPWGEHGPERPAPHHAGGEAPHHQGHPLGETLLDQAGQHPLHQGRAQAAQGGAGDEQGAARQIDAQGAAESQQQQGRREQGARASAAKERRGEQHADPDKPQRQQGDPGQRIHAEGQTGVYPGRQGADGGEKGAQVEGDQHHQHQQGAAARSDEALIHGAGDRRGPRPGWGSPA